MYASKSSVAHTAQIGIVLADDKVINRVKRTWKGGEPPFQAELHDLLLLLTVKSLFCVKDVMSCNTFQSLSRSD